MNEGICKCGLQEVNSKCLNAYFIAHNIGQVAADASEQPNEKQRRKKNADKISLIWVKQLI